MTKNSNRFVPPYNETYAELYNELWPLNPTFIKESEFHIETIKRFIAPDGSWLDTGCGTGYFLSQFRGFKRAGFDKSEPMLRKASEANPDAEFLSHHDISKPNQKWNNKWSLVTCTGQPWSYLRRIDLIETTVKNLYDWTEQVNGKCILTPVDVLDMFNLRPEYVFELKKHLSTPTTMNAIVWSHKESETMHQHENLMYPNFDQWVRWFSIYFNQIELIQWPIEGYNIPRRCLVCSRKKEKPNDKEPTLIGFEDYIKKHH